MAQAWWHDVMVSYADVGFHLRLQARYHAALRVKAVVDNIGMQWYGQRLAPRIKAPHT